MGNIIGENFDSYVDKQVKVRQEVLGKKNLSGNDLMVYSGTSPFIKLASSVNLLTADELLEGTNIDPTTAYANMFADSVSDAFSIAPITPGSPVADLVLAEYKAFYEKRAIIGQLVNLGFSRSELVGNNLAKKCVLFGGVTSEPNETYASSTRIHRGLNPGQGNNVSEYMDDFYENANPYFYSGKFAGAYGFGGIQDRGYVPMPGITDIQTKYYNNGALQQATVNIKCYSKQQFALIDALYLRPGYTVLLEFGHSKFYNNDTKKIQFVRNTNAYNKFMEGGVQQYEIYNAIEASREGNAGNYDALYGKISKFSWKFNKDGSYNITVNIIGLGSVIESLRADSGTPSPLNLKKIVSDTGYTNDNYYKKLSDSSRSILHAMLIHQRNKIRRIYNKGQTSHFVQYKKQTFYSVNTVEFESRSLGTSGYVRATEKKVDKKFGIGTLDIDLQGCDRTYNGSPGGLRMPEALLGILDTTTVVNGLPYYNSAFQTYVKFGALISMIQYHCLIYDENNVPFFKFDMNDGGLPTTGNGGAQSFKDDENYYFSIPGSSTGNPLVCMVPPQFSPNGYPTVANRVVTDLFRTICYDAKGYRHRAANENYYCSLANIFVNVDHAVEVLDQHTDEDGNISILTFLQTLLNDIFNALGGYTEIELNVGDNGLVKFVNKIPPQYTSIIDLSDEETTMINTFGVKPGTQGSFVRDIDLLSELSPEFGAMIAIGAQANGNQVSSNATSFSSYNFGLEDRIIKEKFTDINQLEDVKDFKTQYQQLIDDYNEATNSVFKKLLFLPEYCDILQSAYNRRIQFLLGDLIQQSTVSPFFLPFDLKLTLDGISGIKLFQRFKVDDNVLPPAYTSKMVDLIVKSVEHTVTPAGWTTTIGTLSAPSPIAGELFNQVEEGADEADSLDPAVGTTDGGVGGGDGYTPSSTAVAIPPDSSGGTIPEVTVPTDLNPFGLSESRLGLSDGKVDKLQFFLPVPYYIRNDGEGKGTWGAPRGSRRHKGLDLIAYPGQTVYAAITGKVKLTKTKSTKDMWGLKIEGTGDFAGYGIFNFYCYPFVNLIGNTIEQGQPVGVLQDLSKYGNTFSYNGKGDYSDGVGDHVHFGVYNISSGVKFNPTLGLGVINYIPKSLTYSYLGDQVTLRNFDGDITGTGPVDPRITI